jgi:hypothetical protein
MEVFLLYEGLITFNHMMYHIFFCIHLLVDILVPAMSCLLWIMLLWTWEFWLLFKILILTSLDMYPKAGLLDLMVSPLLTLRTLALHKDCTSLYSHQQCTRDPFSPHLYLFLTYFLYILTVILTSMRWGLNFHWLVMLNHLFIFLSPSVCVLRSAFSCPLLPINLSFYFYLFCLFACLLLSSFY